jgi:hypothetical protein
MTRSSRRAQLCTADRKGFDGESWRRLLAPVRERAVALADAGDVVILRGGLPARGDHTRGVLRYRLADGGRNL